MYHLFLARYLLSCHLRTVFEGAQGYLTNVAAEQLVSRVFSLSCQQHQLGMRIIISTQVPTVMPPHILHLTSFIVCHNFTSPMWYAYLSGYVSTGATGDTEIQDLPTWFDDVTQLQVGQGLLFSSDMLTQRSSFMERAACSSRRVQGRLNTLKFT